MVCCVCVSEAEAESQQKQEGLVSIGIRPLLQQRGE